MRAKLRPCLGAGMGRLLLRGRRRVALWFRRRTIRCRIALRRRLAVYCLPAGCIRVRIAVWLRLRWVRCLGLWRIGGRSSGVSVVTGLLVQSGIPSVCLRTARRALRPTMRRVFLAGARVRAVNVRLAGRLGVRWPAIVN